MYIPAHINVGWLGGSRPNTHESDAVKLGGSLRWDRDRPAGGCAYAGKLVTSILSLGIPQCSN